MPLFGWCLPLPVPVESSYVVLIQYTAYSCLVPEVLTGRGVAAVLSPLQDTLLPAWRVSIAASLAATGQDWDSKHVHMPHTSII